MPNTFKIALLSFFLVGTLFAFADRGINRKAKNRVVLNLPTNNNFTKALSLNLRSGVTYTGSLISNVQENKMFTNLVTFQKGNTTYIVPFKQKIIVSEIKQGYTGMKLIIKSH